MTALLALAQASGGEGSQSFHSVIHDELYELCYYCKYFVVVVAVAVVVVAIVVGVVVVAVVVVGAVTNTNTLRE